MTTRRPGTRGSSLGQDSGCWRIWAPPTGPTSTVTRSPVPPPYPSACRSGSAAQPLSCDHDPFQASAERSIDPSQASAERSMTLTLRYAARSDRGLIRDGNQDSVYAGPRLLAVADGMGGMAAGDVASNITIGAMAPLDEDVPGDAMVDALRSAVETANQQLRDAVDANPALEGMGTTLTAMLFSDTKFGMVHVGDSRAYLLRDSDFVQVTKDDTYVQMLVDEGRISAEEASSHPQRSLLTRALDGRDIDPEYSVRQAVPGDRYLICSDGLSGVVSAETIGQSLREYPDPNQCVDRLVQLAPRGGGPDNVTGIVADVANQDIPQQRPIVGGAAARDRGVTSAVGAGTPACR